MPSKKRRKQKKQKSKKQPERFEHGIICGDTMDSWLKLLRPKPQPKAETLPEPEKKQERPAFIRY
jgi:hypothetical protein